MVYKIGLENEFTGVLNELDYGIFQFESEYYSNQFEDNQNLISFNSKQQFPIVLKELFNNSLAKIVSAQLYDMIMYRYNKILTLLSPNLVYEGYGSLIFNGIHITLSRELVNHLFGINDDLSNLIGKIDINSWRKLLSHHIFGYFRDSNYNFKRREKFIPLNFKEEYLELRFPEAIDFLNPLKFNSLIKYIDTLIIPSKTKLVLNQSRPKTRFERLINIKSEYIGDINEVSKIAKLLITYKAIYLDIENDLDTNNKMHLKIKDVLLYTRNVSFNIEKIVIEINEETPNIREIFEKISNIDFVETYHTKLLERYKKNPNSIFAKLLISSNIKLLKYQTKLYPLLYYPTIHLKRIEQNKFLVNLRLNISVLTDIYFSLCKFKTLTNKLINVKDFSI